MTLQPELMNAILSMDAYNRGYDASIEVTGNAVGSAQIATTVNDLGQTVNLDSSILNDSDQAIGHPRNTAWIRLVTKREKHRLQGLHPPFDFVTNIAKTLETLIFGSGRAGRVDQRPMEAARQL